MIKQDERSEKFVITLLMFAVRQRRVSDFKALISEIKARKLGNLNKDATKSITSQFSLSSPMSLFVLLSSMLVLVLLSSILGLLLLSSILVLLLSSSMLVLLLLSSILGLLLLSSMLVLLLLSSSMLVLCLNALYQCIPRENSGNSTCKYSCFL